MTKHDIIWFTTSGHTLASGFTSELVFIPLSVKGISIVVTTNQEAAVKRAHRFELVPPFCFALYINSYEIMAHTNNKTFLFPLLTREQAVASCRTLFGANMTLTEEDLKRPQVKNSLECWSSFVLSDGNTLICVGFTYCLIFCWEKCSYHWDISSLLESRCF